MDVGRQKLRKNCDFEVSRATLTHEMDFGLQKLRKIATLLRRGRCRRSATKRNPFARNGRWTSKTEEILRVLGPSRATLYARNGGWTSKTEEKLRLLLSQSQPFRTKWTLDVKNWGKIATLSPSIATLTHEMDVGRQKLTEEKLYLVNRNPFARNGRWTSKTEEKLRLLSVARNPFARNGRWTSKIEEKLRFYLVNRNPFARNGRWTSKIVEKLRFYLVNRNPFARNGRWTSKIEEKLRFYLVTRNPFARNGPWTSKTEEKLRWTLSFV